MAPYIIEGILAHIGKGINGGLCYIGAIGSKRKIVYSLKDPEAEKGVIEATPEGLIRCDVGVTLQPNLGRNWKMVVGLNNSDDYEVLLWRPANREESEAGKLGVIVAHEIASDFNLRQIVERVYDDAYKAFYG